MRGVHRVEEWLALSQPLLCDRGVRDNYSSRAHRGTESCFRMGKPQSTSSMETDKNPLTESYIGLVYKYGASLHYQISISRDRQLGEEEEEVTFSQPR